MSFNFRCNLCDYETKSKEDIINHLASYEMHFSDIPNAVDNLPITVLSITIEQRKPKVKEGV